MAALGMMTQRWQTYAIMWILIHPRFLCVYFDPKNSKGKCLSCISISVCVTKNQVIHHQHHNISDVPKYNRNKIREA